MSEREKAERVKQIIANRERIFAEANDGLYHVVFKGLNYYSKFPEAKRKQIYKYAVRLDDESGGMMDWDEGNKRVAEKYGISVTEARNISLEGAMKLWPQPEPPEPDFWRVK